MVAREFIWDRDGLIRVIGHTNFSIGTGPEYPHFKNQDFINSYPNLMYGYNTARNLTNKEIKNAILAIKK